MKLLYCQWCQDVFKLGYSMRSCECGKIQGRYLNNSQAEVSADAISLAIGNGSLMQSIVDMQVNVKTTGGTADRSSYYQDGKGKIEYAWVRPNSGEGNPHTSIIGKES